MIRRRTWIVRAPLIAGVLSLLVWPGTRKLVLFNLQQILPARAGATYFSLWHPPDSPFERDVSLPFWRHWRRIYEKRQGDWRIHAARAYRPSEVWTAGEPDRLKDRSPEEEMAESLMEFEIAARLAPENPAVAIAPAVLRMSGDERFAMTRIDYARQEYRYGALAEDWSTPPLPAEVTKPLFAAVERVRSLDPRNGFTDLIEARLLLSLGRDAKAFAALDAACGKPYVLNYAPDLAENCREFLMSLGTPFIEANAESLRDHPWRPAMVDLMTLLGLMGNRARENGDDAEALRLFRYALRACDGLPRHWSTEWAALRVLPYVAADKRHEMSDEERWRLAEPYLMDQGGQDIAARMRAAMAQFEQYRVRMQENRRPMILPLYAYGALFASALILAYCAILGAVAGVSSHWGPHSAPPPNRWMTGVMHSWCLVFVAVVAFVGAAASTPYWLEVNLGGGDGWDLPVVISYFVPLVFLGLAGLMPYVKERSSRVVWKNLGKLICTRVAPLALVYCGYAYVVCTWVTWALREEMVRRVMG